MEYQKPDYALNFDDDKGQVVSPDRADLHELTKKVMQSMNSSPVLESLPDTFIKLPAGLVRDDEVLQDAEVQELTGEHEERLAKSRTSGNPSKYVSTLLQCGTIAIGDVKVTPEILESLIQGDLDMLLLGIRRATFGDDFEVIGVECAHCGEANDLKLNLADIPVKKLDNPADREFAVPLRKNRSAKIQFPTGSVQTEIFKKQISLPEMNSITLAHCVLSFISPDGTEIPCNGLTDVKKLGVSDRKTILDFIFDNQPGPRYDQVTALCHSCEGEVPVPLTVGILFREL